MHLTDACQMDTELVNYRIECHGLCTSEHSGVAHTSKVIWHNGHINIVSTIARVWY